uniref:Uncharacterized protein n=1 Tax=Rhizophora mucronata TaxID=61149 RepID=A0A2P2MFH1_RHIMU
MGGYPQVIRDMMFRMWDVTTAHKWGKGNFAQMLQPYN